MSVDISLSPTESDSAPSSSSFGSMSESSLPKDKMEQLIRKLRSENKQLQLRVLGVNELARLLQDRSEKVKVLEDKNKRLEVAVVRLENRCANLEQKLRAEGGGGGPPSGLKSMQPPSIPGPSRQILEALMKENSELKKALNAMQKKGPSGYLEAVKTSQLEEVIEQQKQELEFLRSQVNMLTTTPLPPSSAGSGGSETSSSSSRAPGSPGDLRRQLIKMQHSLKVKDRFCSLLSDQVASLQDRLRDMSLDEVSRAGADEEGKKPPPSQLPQATPDAINDNPMIQQIKEEYLKKKEELEGRYEQVIKEQKETLQKERQEHRANVEKLQKADQDLKKLRREIDALDKRCEDLQFHNHTLLDDKKQLQETLGQMKAAGSRVNEGGGLERELRELQDSFHQKVVEHSEELKNKDKEMQHLRMLQEDIEYKYVIADSKLSEIEKEHEQRMSDVKDKLDYMEMDRSSKQNEIERLQEVNLQLKMDNNNLRSKSGASDPTITRPPTRLPADRCDTTGHLQTYHPMELVARNLGEDEPPQSQPPTSQGSQHMGSSTHPSSLTFRTQTTPPHHASPSSAATPHQSVHPGRRSPVSPFSQAAPPLVPRPTHPQQHPYSAHSSQLYHLSASYSPQMRSTHPVPQTHYDPPLIPGGPHPLPGQPYSPAAGFGGQGSRPPQSGSPVPPGAMGSPPQRPPMDNEPHTPHGYHGDPSGSAHHHHHAPRRN
jgi:hypothetical protein